MKQALQKFKDIDLTQEKLNQEVLREVFLLLKEALDSKIHYSLPFKLEELTFDKGFEHYKYQLIDELSNQNSNNENVKNFLNLLVYMLENIERYIHDYGSFVYLSVLEKGKNKLTQSTEQGSLNPVNMAL